MPSSGSAGVGRKSRVELPGPGWVGWKTRVVRVRREREIEEGRNGSGKKMKGTLTIFLFILKIPDNHKLLLTIILAYKVRFTRATCLRTRIVVLYNFREGSFSRNPTD